MVSEDPETYDIHADIVGGWPKIVSPVLQHTHSLDYNPNQFPNDLHEKIESSIKSLLNIAEQDSVKPQSFQLAKGGMPLKTLHTFYNEPLVYYGITDIYIVVCILVYQVLSLSHKVPHLLM